MLPTIIAGGDTVLRAEFVSSSLTPQTQLIHIKSDSSLKIKDIQALQSQLIITARLPRVVWIEEANTLTQLAQNSLLKLLEEPPRNTQFYLSCTNSQNLLPTIRSRCHITKLSKSLQFDSQILVDLKNILALPLGSRLQSTPKLDRATALLYFSALQTALKSKLGSPNLSSTQQSLLTSIAKLTLKTTEALLRNVSVSLAYNSFLLHLPKSK